MDTKEWKDLKNLLSSLLISSPLQLTIRTLNNDFRNEIGYNIPYEKFGFRTLEQCLDGMPDVLTRNGSYITVCVSRKSAHIDKLVSRQAIPSLKRSKSFQQPRRHFSTQQNCMPSLFAQPVHLTRTQMNYLQRMKTQPEIRYEPRQPKSTSNLENDKRCESAVPVPLTIQKNLINLIAKFDKGIWCTELPKTYIQLYKQELDYSKYGYKSLILMCVALKKIFYCHRPNKADFILYDRVKPLPDRLETNVTQELDCEIKPTKIESVINQHQPKSLYPLNVLQLFDVIPKQFMLSDIKKDEFVEVVVADIFTPSRFFVILMDKDRELDNLMDEMQVFYSEKKNEYQIPEFMVSENLYAVTLYEQEYHRVKITEVIAKRNLAKVFCVDYGSAAYVSLTSLFFLHKEFAVLPQQGIESKLAGIQPSDHKTQWSKEASVRLLELALHEHLYAHIYNIDRLQQRLDMFLVDTSSKSDVYFNDVLVKEGYAAFVGVTKNDSVSENVTPHSRKQLLKQIVDLYARKQ